MMQSRRSFLKSTVTASGTLLVYFNLGALAQEQDVTTEVKANPMPFIEMDNNGNITFISSRTDMGQGSPTSLAQILLDEMDADWDKLVHVRETEETERSAYEEGLSTIGAISTIIGWFNHRKAGACLRGGFKLAAASIWQVDEKGLITEKSKVINPTNGEYLEYHQLYQKLSDLYLADVPEFKTREQATLVGKPLRQLRTRERVTGNATYGIDVSFPELKIGMIERCPTFGGSVKSFDGSKAREIPGVIDIFQVSNGVAIVAEGFWAAKKGREALEIEWDHGPLSIVSSEEIEKQLEDKLVNPDQIEKNEGDAANELAKSSGVKLSGDFNFPFVAHATMEPMNATAWVTRDRCEIWAPTQCKLDAHDQVAKFLGRNRNEIVLHRTLCGGGFGRRAQEDFVIEAVEASHKSGYPVKLIWTREDDMRHDYYRSISKLQITGKINDEGELSAWDSKLSFIDTSPYHFSPQDRNTKDGLFVGHAGIVPAYKIPNINLSYGYLDLPITVGILRGISHGYTNFAIEVMIDRLAKKANIDTLELRANLLNENERASTVIDTLKKVDQENPVLNGMGRGYAFAYEGEPGSVYQYYSAHMADVRHLDDGSLKVHKIWIVADHGRVINPASFKRQIHSSIYFALSMMRSGEITMTNGQMEQSNFDNYPVSFIGEGAEHVEIKLLDNGAHPMGCGEKMQAGIQPAIANAIENLTGEEVNGIPVKRLA